MSHVFLKQNDVHRFVFSKMCSCFAYNHDFEICLKKSKRILKFSAKYEVSTFKKNFFFLY